MKFFLDTGIVEEIREAAKWGLVDGVTTNPSLIAKTGRSQREVIEEICSIIDGPISAEVISLDYEGMISEAAELKELHKNIVVKLPMTEAGVSACKWCSDQGIKVNMTLVFSSMQALLCAKNGATYVSPFIGRVDDIGQDGVALIAEIRQIFDNYGFETEVLAASIRTVPHVRECSIIGADVATMPINVMKHLFGHPLTDKGIDGFMKDHATAQANL
jgi:transaldolase